MGMLSDRECDKLVFDCLGEVNKVARLVNDQYGGIRDINDNLKGRTTKDKFHYLKSILKEFPDIQKIRKPYLTLRNERNDAIGKRDVIWRKLHNCSTLLEEKMDELNLGKDELKKRFHELDVLAKKREKLVNYLEGWGQEKAGVRPAIKFLSQLKDLYKIEFKAMSKNKAADDPLQTQKEDIPTPSNKKGKRVRKRRHMDYDDEMKSDIQKLIKQKQITNVSIDKIIEGKSMDFHDPCLAIALFERWRDRRGTAISDDAHKNQIIEDNITIKGKHTKTGQTISNARTKFNQSNQTQKYKDMLSDALR
jgi:hypothetical protein